MRKTKNGFDFGYFKITKREILASVTIVAVMMLIGILIAGKISDSQMDANEKYNKAIKIQSEDMFQHGLDTDVGNAFVYGDLKAVDTVTYPEIGGEYMYVEKVKEEYTMHTETYTTTDSKGHTQTHTRTYWSWDRVGSEDITCNEVSFCDVTFPSNKIDLPGTDYIDTINESSDIRYKYYGTGTEYKGTIFANLKDHTISDNTKFYNNRTIDETVDYLESDFPIVLFWILWIVLTGGTVFGFYYLDNKWLEN